MAFAAALRSTLTLQRGENCLAGAALTVRISWSGSVSGIGHPSRPMYRMNLRIRLSNRRHLREHDACVPRVRPQGRTLIRLRARNVGATDDNACVAPEAQEGATHVSRGLGRKAEPWTRREHTACARRVAPRSVRGRSSCIRFDPKDDSWPKA
jgi:hypothetical protein